MDKALTRLVIELAREIKTLEKAHDIGRKRSQVEDWPASRQARVGKEIRKEAFENIDRLVTEYVQVKTDIEEKRMTEKQTEETESIEAREVRDAVVGPLGAPMLGKSFFNDHAARTRYMIDLHRGLVANFEKVHQGCSHSGKGGESIGITVLEDDTQPSIYWPVFDEPVGLTFLQESEEGDEPGAWSLVFVAEPIKMYAEVITYEDPALQAELVSDLVSEVAIKLTSNRGSDRLLEHLAKVFGG